MTLNAYMNQGRKDRIIEAGTCKYIAAGAKVKCADGYEVSVQASYGNYCSPRKSLEDVSAYTEFELGFPNQPDDLINDYAETDEYTDTVYAYVPRKVVEALIEKHGGIAN